MKKKRRQKLCKVSKTTNKTVCAGEKSHMYGRTKITQQTAPLEDCMDTPSYRTAL